MKKKPPTQTELLSLRKKFNPLQLPETSWQPVRRSQSSLRRDCRKKEMTNALNTECVFHQTQTIHTDILLKNLPSLAPNPAQAGNKKRGGGRPTACRQIHNETVNITEGRRWGLHCIHSNLASVILAAALPTCSFCFPACSGSCPDERRLFKRIWVLGLVSFLYFVPSSSPPRSFCSSVRDPGMVLSGGQSWGCLNFPWMLLEERGVWLERGRTCVSFVGSQPN